MLGRCECRPACDFEECGLDGCGGYCAPCFQGVAYRYDEQGEPVEVVTEVYCDDALRRCVPPLEACADGWCRIPAGSFRMGHDGQFPNVDAWPDGVLPLGPVYPAHPVVLTRSFLIQQTEVTVAQYQQILETTALPSRFAACGPDCPVTTVTVFDALHFANRLSEREGRPACYTLEECNEALTGYGLECARARFAGPDCAGYRLPSEAEWEHAARAGSPWCLPNGYTIELSEDCAPNEDADAVAWFCPNAAVTYEGCADLNPDGMYPNRPRCAGPHPVAQKRQNRFGLYDTSGNVYELTGTLFRDYLPHLAVDPGFDEVIDAFIVVRGGGFFTPLHMICSGSRSTLALSARAVRWGLSSFRLVRTLPPEPPSR